MGFWVLQAIVIIWNYERERIIRAEASLGGGKLLADAAEEIGTNDVQNQKLDLQTNISSPLFQTIIESSLQPNKS